MGINLLPQVETTKIKKKKRKLKRFIFLGVWILSLILIEAILFFYKGYMNAKLAYTKTKEESIKQRLLALEPLYSNYYNIAYKTSVLNYVKQKRYSPKVMYLYISKQIGDLGTVSRYEFNAKGDISINITTDSYEKGVFIWHRLLKDPDKITTLNLSNFSKDRQGNVHFTLKGRLNLEKISN